MDKFILVLMLSLLVILLLVLIRMLKENYRNTLTNEVLFFVSSIKLIWSQTFVKNIVQVIPDEMIHSGVRIKQTKFTFPWLAD